MLSNQVERAEKQRISRRKPLAKNNMFASVTPLRPVGSSGLKVSAVALGCWPIAGMSSLDVNTADSLATLHAALDHGINFLDTAYCYGPHGESEQLIGQAIAGRRDKVVIATKGGLHWEGSTRIQDATAGTLIRECEESLQRLNTDRIDLYYLHAPAPGTPVAESARGIRHLRDQGKVLTVGASNLTLTQLQEFQEVCPLDAYQPPYNMLQREIEHDILPWCQSHKVSVMVYWPLLKGLLSRKVAARLCFSPRRRTGQVPDVSRRRVDSQPGFRRRPASNCKRYGENSSTAGHTLDD